MEVTIDNANIMVLLGCERDVFEEKAKGNITVYITSNTNIDTERLSKFAKACHGKKQGCKLVLKREEDYRKNNVLYSSEKVY